MANYYLKFSFDIIDVSLKEKEWVENALKTNRHKYCIEDDEIELGFEYQFFGNTADDSDVSLSIGTWETEYGNPDGAAQFVCDFLREFRPNDCVTFSCAAYCDKARPDHFSGIGYLVTADWFETVDTGGWANTRGKVFKRLKSTGKTVTLKDIESCMMMEGVLNK